MGCDVVVDSWVVEVVGCVVVVVEGGSVVVVVVDVVVGGADEEVVVASVVVVVSRWPQAVPAPVPNRIGAEARTHRSAVAARRRPFVVMPSAYGRSRVRAGTLAVSDNRGPAGSAGRGGTLATTKRGRPSMQLDIHVPRFTWPGGQAAIGPTFTSLAQTAEAIGVRTLSVMDHWFQMEMLWPADEPMLEGYTTLSFAAAKTDRLRFRMLVGGVTYRHPGLLAKTITTLDVLSGGRAELGLGAAWYEREHLGLGVPFPPLTERYERLEETCRSACRCGATTMAPSRASTTGWRRPCACPSP